MPASALVVGAGFAGLAAARTLRDRGVDRITVVDACSGPGGRARTGSLRTLGGGAWPDVAVELGATWLHGTVGHPALQAAIDAGLVDSAAAVTRAARGQFGQSRYHTPTSRGPLTGPSRRRVRAGVDAYAAAVEVASMTRAEPGLSIGDATAAGVAPRDPLAAAGAHWRELLQRAMDGCDTTADLSAAGHGRYTDLPGGHAPLACGYGAIAAAVAEALARDGVRLRYCTRVTRLAHGPADVAACIEGETEVLTADVAVVAVPLGVLQGGRLAFDPPLPHLHTDALRELRPGAVAKLFTLFEGDTAAGWCAGGRRGVAAVHLLWPAGDYNDANSTPSPPIPAWACGIFSIRVGGPELKGGARSAPVGVSWLAGDAARAAEAAPHSDLVAGVRAALAAFPSAARALPGALVDACVTTWSSDALFGGSYSYLPPTAAALDAQATLRLPLVAGATPTPRVAFAGEAMSHAHIGTVHGAWLEGVRAASDLVPDGEK